MNNAQLRRVDFNLLLIFNSIMKHRKLSLAAEELKLTRSAISHALVRLRDIFNDPLFVRQQAGVQITPRALTLSPKIATLINLASDALMIDRNFDAAVDKRMLRVGMPEYGTALFAARLCEIMEREAPGMKLTITSLSRAEMVDQMANFQLDLALHSFFREDNPFEVDDLFSDHFVVAAREDHPSIAKRLTRKAYLAAEHILVTREAEPPIRLESNFTRLGHLRKVVLRIPLYLAALEAAAQSDRLLTIPHLLATHYGRHLPLRIHPLPFPRVDFPVSMMSHQTASRDPGVLWLKQKMREVSRSVAAPSREVPTAARNKASSR